MNKFTITERWPNFVDLGRRPRTYEVSNINELLEKAEYYKGWKNDGSTFKYSTTRTPTQYCLIVYPAKLPKNYFVVGYIVTDSPIENFGIAKFEE